MEKAWKTSGGPRRTHEEVGSFKQNVNKQARLAETWVTNQTKRKRRRDESFYPNQTLGMVENMFRPGLYTYTYVYKLSLVLINLTVVLIVIFC